MKKNHYIVTLIALLFTSSIYAQNQNYLKLKSSNYITEENIDQLNLIVNYFENELVNDNYYRIVQFNKMITSTQKEDLTNQGIQPMLFIPNNAFICKIDKNADLTLLKNFGARSVTKLESKFKLSKDLDLKKYNSWALNGQYIFLNGIAFERLTQQQLANALKEVGATLLDINYANIAQIKIPISHLKKLYELPHFYYFEQVDPPSEPENLVGVTNHRSNNLAMAYSTGLKYDGTGITVMLQDNSILNQHIDYTNRFFNINSAQTGDHGEHTAGTIAGAGNLDPTTRGMAFGADVLVYDPNNNNYNDVPTIYTNDNVRITSKSYSNGTNAGYTSLAQQLDQQVRQMPDLVHVFSAGNAGTSGSPSGWYNITGGHKAGKNVIAVGNVTYQDIIANSSSRGPAADGRIKPDICAVGTNVYSTIEPNTYGFKTGTSMACPGVAGILAQLYHAYRDLNGGTYPESALIKAAVLNTGEDLGNTGPDFIYGWGRINARRSYNILANNLYLSSSISQGGNNTHNITVPAGTNQVRIMLYWTDYEGTVSASPALVNDINMSVTDPNSTNYNPWVLDPTPNSTNLNSPAVRGIDNLNNMEQVTIDNPIAGNYTISIDGFSIPQGPQNYFVVYEFVTSDVVLTYPIGGESFNPSVDEVVRWDAFGNSGTFNLEYSTDNGSTWNTIATGISATTRYYEWNVPNLVTGQALVRVTRGASTSQSQQSFSIIGVPTGLTVNWVCPDSMEVAWNTVTGATGYEVSLLGNKYMDSVGTSNGQTSLVIGIQSNQDHWWSVKTLSSNNCIGRRAIAQYQPSGTFNCTLPVDVGASNLTPSNSALQTCMDDYTTVQVTVTNNGQTSASNIPVNYQLNGGTIVSETISGPLAVGASYTYTFTTGMTPNVGSNNMVMWLYFSGDLNLYNDTLISNFNVTNDPPKTLPWSENFETFSNCATTSNCEATVCLVPNDLTNDENFVADDIDWRTDNNGTPSNNTGPNTDFNPGTSTGKYMYLEASNGCDFKQANLITPCIDLTSATSGLLTFAYNMYGGDMGDLHVDIYMNGTWTNDIMTPISGNKGTSWLQSNINLTSYLGNVVNFRFRGVTGNGYRSDIAIDDINVTGANSINKNGVANQLLLYPNPANDNLTISGTKALNNYEVLIYNTIGKLVYTKTQSDNSSELTINISSFNKGVYIMKINADENSYVNKFIKE